MNTLSILVAGVLLALAPLEPAGAALIDHDTREGTGDLVRPRDGGEDDEFAGDLLWGHEPGSSDAAVVSDEPGHFVLAGHSEIFGPVLDWPDWPSFYWPREGDCPKLGAAALPGAYLNGEDWERLAALVGERATELAPFLREQPCLVLEELRDLSRRFLERRGALGDLRGTAEHDVALGQAGDTDDAGSGDGELAPELRLISPSTPQGVGREDDSALGRDASEAGRAYRRGEHHGHQDEPAHRCILRSRAYLPATSP